MKSKRIINSGDKIDQAPATQDPADGLLAEIARLYRERFRALYNDDQPTLKAVNEQIELLKAKLTQL